MKRGRRGRALTRKSRTDLSRRPIRTVLTVLTLALAVASFGIVALPSLMNRAMTAEVARARLYDVSIPVDDVALPPAALAGLVALPNVAAVAARSRFSTKALIGARRVDTDVWGVPDFVDQPVDQVVTTARPGPDEVLVATRDALAGISGAEAGDALRVQAADGSFRIGRPDVRQLAGRTYR
jgi:hypothetical protein